VRWDGGIEAGNEVTLHYDPLIAKLIVWGETRPVALERMRRALRELIVVGIPSSQAFHLRVMDDAEFQRGDVDVAYLERAGPRLLAGGVRSELERPLAVVAALLAEEQRASAAPPPPTVRPPERPSAWVIAARRDALRG
jgi:acetyl/propionyl-CoA carboxylase alpha subunit